MQDDRNPQAFPAGFNEGITLLDYNAAAIMQGMIAGHTNHKAPNDVDIEQYREDFLIRNVKLCYKIADIMLAERARIMARK